LKSSAEDKPERIVPADNLILRQLKIAEEKALPGQEFEQGLLQVKWLNCVFVIAGRPLMKIHDRSRPRALIRTTMIGGFASPCIFPSFWR